MSISLKRYLKRSYSLRFISWLVLLNFVDLLAMLSQRRPAGNTKKRVLFARLDGIGDFVIWSATFDRWAEVYPSAEYEKILVGNKLWQKLAEGKELFDKQIFLDPKRFAVDPIYRFRTIRQIRKLGADIAINPKMTREFLWADSIVRSSGAAERIGSEGYDNLMTAAQERISNGWYTKLVPKAVREDHELESNFKFVCAVDPRSSSEPALPQIGTNGKPAEFDPERPFALFFLGAQTADRVWPIPKFVQAAKFVARDYGLDIVLCGGPGDADQAAEFQIGFGGKAVNLIGKTSLPGLSGVVKQASLVVTNDTGAGHIAAATGTPTVVITPGNQVGRFFPYPETVQKQGMRQVSVFHEMPCFDCGWECIYKDLGPADPKPCIGNVAVEDVNAAIASVLGAKTAV